MVESDLNWFGHVRRRPIKALVRVDHMEDNPIVRGKGTRRKTLEKTIKKDLALNGLYEDLFYDKIRNTMVLFDPCSRSHLVLQGFAYVVAVSAYKLFFHWILLRQL